MSDTPRIDLFFSASETKCLMRAHIHTQDQLEEKTPCHSSNWASCRQSWVSDQLLFHRYYCFAGGRGNQRAEKAEKAEEGRGRASFVFPAEDAKVNNTQHALRGKCGNAGWEVRQWTLRYGEQRDLRECSGGREMSDPCFGWYNGRLFWRRGICRLWKRLNDRT